MARASTPTLLSLDRYAQILGINPAHFNSAAGASVMPVNRNACSDIWRQYNWQWSDSVSREELAQAISSAEKDIAEVLGWYPAPIWLYEEIRQYPRYHRPDVIQYGMLDARAYDKSIKTRWGNVIGPGRRGLSILDGGASAVGYSGTVDEIATVTFATTLTDARQLKVYTTGHDGDQEWEIRPARTKVIDSGTFTVTFWSWQMIDPDLWEALTTTDDPAAIDWTDASNLVTTVDVYQEYNDTTQVSATFYWEPQPQTTAVFDTCSCGNSSCVVCGLTTQDGCLHVRNAEAGLVVPQIGTYDEDDEEWQAACSTECRDPDFVKIWYYAGLLDNGYLASNNNDPLSHWWAETIAWLATARMERPFCSCANVTSLAKKLRTDLTFSGQQGSYNVAFNLLDNPLGTKYGEVMAWQRLSKLAPKRARVAVL